MRPAITILCAAALSAVGAASAHADPFGGFSRAGTQYLVGADRVCDPVEARSALPHCHTVAAAQVSKMAFDKGTVQRGAEAVVTVEAAGTLLRVKARGSGKVLAEWSATDPVQKVEGVYLSKNRKMVGIQYQARMAGRMQSESVALALRRAMALAPGEIPTASGAGGAAGTPGTSAADNPKAVKPLRAADRLLHRKRWKQAEAAYRAVLAIAPNHPAARFGLAAALARQGHGPEAVAVLGDLARSGDREAPYWLVEARQSDHFARLRGDPGFRRAVGIDPDPARPLSAYERVVGLGGTWEQTQVPCQRPRVSLALDRKTGRFSLSIRSRCQGDDETTRLGGTWATRGAATLGLTFPNASGPDEHLACTIDKAHDRSGEDEIGCALGDMHFTLRVVRR